MVPSLSCRTIYFQQHLLFVYLFTNCLHIVFLQDLSCPSVYRGLAVSALRLEIGESLLEGYFHQAVINDPAPTLREHEEVMAEHKPSENINTVMSATENKHQP